MSNETNNGTTLIVLGLLGFLAIIITGKFILSNNQNNDYDRNHFYRDRPPQINVEPKVEITPPILAYPEHHNKSEFWLGYNDGYAKITARLNCPEYLHGYELGRRDRHLNRRDYFDRHYPPGFRIRVPGFRLDIKGKL